MFCDEPISNADTPSTRNTDEETFFTKVQKHSICFIALEDRTLWHATEHSCETDRAIFVFDDEYFFVESNLIGEDKASLAFCRCSNYNHSLFSKKIIPQSGKIEFIKANDSMGACLYFLIDNTILTVAPFDTYLIISLTGAGPDDIDIQALDRDQLW